MSVKSWIINDSLLFFLSILVNYSSALFGIVFSFGQSFFVFHWLLNFLLLFNLHVFFELLLSIFFSWFLKFLKLFLFVFSSPSCSFLLIHSIIFRTRKSIFIWNLWNIRACVIEPLRWMHCTLTVYSWVFNGWREVGRLVINVRHLLKSIWFIQIFIHLRLIVLTILRNRLLSIELLSWFSLWWRQVKICQLLIQIHVHNFQSNFKF